MSRHRIVSHKEVKAFRMRDNLTLKQIILFNVTVLTIGMTLSVAMVNPIPIIIAGIVAIKSHNSSPKIKSQWMINFVVY